MPSYLPSQYRVDFWQVKHASATAQKGGALRDLRDAAVLVVMSDGLLRTSEVAALQVDDATYQLDGRWHPDHPVEQNRPGRTRSRVGGDRRGPDQGMAGESRHPGGTFVSPRLLKNSRVGKATYVDSVWKIIKKRCAAIGIVGKVSGHSLRGGRAQSLAADGASLPEMQTAGRREIAADARPAKGAVARIKYGE